MESIKIFLKHIDGIILSSRNVFEFIYFVSGAFIAFCAIKALAQVKLIKSQIKLIKYDIESRSKRDSLLTTNELIFDINSSIYNKLGAIAVTFEAIRSGRFNHETIDFNNPTDKQKEDALNVFNLLESDDVNNIVSILSSLEMFAFKTLNGLAVETIAFKSAGVQYCRIVQFLSPCILRISDFQIHPTQSHIIDLFNNWSHKIKKEVLDAEQSKLISELKTINDKSKELNITDIDTIGIKPQA